MPFAEIGLHPDLVRAVKAMDYVKPTPIQEAAIPLALAGKDVLGCAQTGGGKTAAFALPILHHLLKEDRPGIRVLVLTPTRELAAQVEMSFRDCGRFTSFKTAVVIGGVGFHPQVSAARHAQVLVATPGRLLDHLKQGSFRLDAVEHLVLDEADRMFDMGFLPDIRSVIQQLPKDRQTLLFSATLVPEVERIAAFALRHPERVEISKPTTVAEGISQILYPVVQSQKAGLLLHLLKTTEMKSVLVFSRTKHGADKLAKRLIAEGHPVGVLHGNRSQNQRTAAMEGFRKGRIKMLVATDIAARGIDVKGISHVVNYDVPRFPEDYVHRVGRTARAYGVGDAITFMDPSLETGCVRDIERFVGITFPRATLPGFQYNAPPRESEGREPRREGHGQGGHRQGGQRQAPRHDNGHHRQGDNRHRDQRPGGQRQDGNRRDGQHQGGNRQGGQRPDGNRQDGNRRDGQFRGDPNRQNGQRHENRPVNGNRRDAPRNDNRFPPRRDERRPEFPRRDDRPFEPKKDPLSRFDAPRYKPPTPNKPPRGYF